MQPNHSSKQSDSGRSPYRLLLSVGLPFLLVLAFLGKQVVNFDSIGWSNGFSHPLMGWDHLVTMLAVGVWAAQLRGQAIWMLPLAFVGVMSLGGLAGAAGLAIPSVEGIILLSCAVFSVLITRKVRFSAQVNVLIVAFFAFFHGFAHGQEISTSASLISYTLGFMLATLLLHGAGILVAKLVVFGVTCLLTAMFANAALAKSVESSLDNSSKAATELVDDAGLAQKIPFWVALNSSGEADREALLTERQQLRSQAAVLEACRDALNRPSVGSDRFQAHPTKIAINASQGGNGHQLLAKPEPSRVLAICVGKSSFNGDHLVDAGLDFRHYYRDVNHTPGKRLLSNGVGLTSPPAGFQNVPTSPFSPDLRSTPISDIEGLVLQSPFANPNPGNRFTQTIHDIKHANAVIEHSCALTLSDRLRAFAPAANYPFKRRLARHEIVWRHAMTATPPNNVVSPFYHLAKRGCQLANITITSQQAIDS